MLGTWRAIGWLLAALALVPFVGCRGPEAPAAAAMPDQGDAEGPTVPIVRPERMELRDSTTQPATVHPDHRAEIHARVAGYFEELKVDIGDAVEAGQVLGVVSVPEMRRSMERQEAVIRRLEADERRASAEVALAGAEVDAAEASLERSRAEIDRAEAQLKGVQAELDRVEGLVAEGAVTSRLLDETRQRFESSRAEKAAVEASLTSARADVAVAEASRAAAEARAETSEAESAVSRKELEELETMVAFATLLAPFDGVVTDRQVDPGDLVRDSRGSSGGDRPPLFVVAKLDRVRVRVPIPENDAPRADVGDGAEVSFRAIPGRSFEGVVSRVARGLDPSTRTMLVEIDLPNPGLELLPGMYGEATITLERTEGLVLPAGTVRFDESGRSFVYVVDDEGLVRIVDVEAGMDDGTRIEITKGLDGSERIVAPTIDRLEEGQRVRVEEG